MEVTKEKWNGKQTSQNLSKLIGINRGNEMCIKVLHFVSRKMTLCSYCCVVREMF